MRVTNVSRFWGGPCWERQATASETRAALTALLARHPQARVGAAGERTAVRVEEAAARRPRRLGWEVE